MARPNLLIVEDDVSSANAMAELGAHYDFEVHAVRSISEARKRLEISSVEFAIVDLMMPDGLGTELLLEPRCGRFGKVLVTGYPTLESSVAALRAGVHDYLVKPVDVERLRQVMSDVRERTRTEDGIVAIKPFVGRPVDEVERLLIFATLRATQGNKAAAARTLGVSLKTLYNKLNAYQSTGRLDSSLG